LIATPIAKESQHFYYPDGRPCYEVPRAKGDGMRPATLADARKLGLLPGYSSIEKLKAKPGLEAWKLKQLLMASLTLPRLDGESEDAYAERVITDSREEGLAALERGTALHTAIELSLLGQPFDPTWEEHVAAVRGTLAQYGIEWKGSAEKTFGHPSLGYGGKVDMSWDAPGLLDFKTKPKIQLGTRLAYDEHVMQLSAYSMGLFNSLSVRAVSVFVGVADKEIVIFEWTPKDLLRGFKMFLCLLDLWYLQTGLERPMLKAAVMP
jgi:hypothetical protein